MPRKPRRNQPETGLTPIATPLEQVIERAGLGTAADMPLTKLVRKRKARQAPAELPAAELPPPESEVIEPRFTERVRPEGPRKRAVGEPGSVFTSVNGGFKLTDDGMERAFKFADEIPPGHDEKAALHEAGFGYRPGRKVWTAPANPETRDTSDRLALRFSGKAETIGR